MTKVSTLAHRATQLFAAMLLIAFVTLTAGCGGGSTGTTPPPSGDIPPPSTPPPPDPVQGIATPTSVAVVTATNA